MKCLNKTCVIWGDGCLFPGEKDEEQCKQFMAEPEQKAEVPVDSQLACSVHLWILVTAKHEGKTVCGYLTGTGAGKYTGLFVEGKTIAVAKNTVAQNEPQ